MEHKKELKKKLPRTSYSVLQIRTGKECDRAGAIKLWKYPISREEKRIDNFHTMSAHVYETKQAGGKGTKFPSQTFASIRPTR